MLVKLSKGENQILSLTLPLDKKFKKLSVISQFETSQNQASLDTGAVQVALFANDFTIIETTCPMVLLKKLHNAMFRMQIASIFIVIVKEQALLGVSFDSAACFNKVIRHIDNGNNTDENGTLWRMFNNNGR